MGYIAPVNHEQYIQYANRLIRVNKPEPLKLLPIKKITITENSIQHQGRLDAKKKNESTSTKENLMFQITGKGRYINELI